MFSVDVEAVKNLDGTSMYYAGLIIQCWYFLILARSLLITILAFKSRMDVDLMVAGMLHCCLSCFDIFVLGGLVIWGTVALNDFPTEQCQALPEDVGCN